MRPILLRAEFWRSLVRSPGLRVNVRRRAIGAVSRGSGLRMFVHFLVTWVVMFERTMPGPHPAGEIVPVVLKSVFIYKWYYGLPMSAILLTIPIHIPDSVFPFGMRPFFFCVSPLLVMIVTISFVLLDDVMRKRRPMHLTILFGASGMDSRDRFL